MMASNASARRSPACSSPIRVSTMRPSVSDAEPRHCPRDRVSIALAVELRRVHCDYGETLWRISRVDVLEPWQRVAAIRATEGPELDQHQPAAERGEREGR